MKELKELGHDIISTNKYKKSFIAEVELIGMCKNCGYVFYKWRGGMYIFNSSTGIDGPRLWTDIDEVAEFPSCDELIIRDIIE